MKVKYVCTYKEVQLNSELQLEIYRPQNNRPAQQYSSATFQTLRVPSRKQNLGARFISIFLNSVSRTLLNSGPVCNRF
jgi:hypothetical protein